jgi:hypothetical protein
MSGGKPESAKPVPPDHEIERDGGYVTERFRLNGVPHRFDGPAVIQRREDNNRVVYEAYYRHGLRHRDGGKAAELAFHGDTGLCISATSWENGERLCAFFRSSSGRCRVRIYGEVPKSELCTLERCAQACALRALEPRRSAAQGGAGPIK